MKTNLVPTPLEGLFIVEIEPFRDSRGFFIEPWNARDYAAAGLDAQFVQEGHSRSTKGVLRGMHYQNMQAPMGKLVRCTVGEIFDVAVDLRTSAKTFGRWFGIHLTAANMKQLFVPVGFAHGFATVSDVAEVQYKQTGYYMPSAEGGILWNDPDVAIEWPITNPVLSEKDAKQMSLEQYRAHPAFT